MNIWPLPESSLSCKLKIVSSMSSLGTRKLYEYDPWLKKDIQSFAKVWLLVEFRLYRPLWRVEEKANFQQWQLVWLVMFKGLERLMLQTARLWLLQKYSCNCKSCRFTNLTFRLCIHSTFLVKCICGGLEQWNKADLVFQGKRINVNVVCCNGTQ